MSTQQEELPEHIPALAPTTLVPREGAVNTAVTNERPDAELAPASEGLWAGIRDSLRGVSHDYTQGPIGRAILLLAVPMVLEMALESVFAITDIFFVGRLGPDAVATVGLTESLLTTIYALAIGLSIGATAIVARRIGEKNAEGAAESAVQAIILSLGVSLVLGVTGALGAPTLLRAMGASPEVLATGSTYARVMLGGQVSVIVLFVVNAIFRGAGDAAIAMRVLWLANGLNIVLGPCLIFGLGPFPKLGVTGAAVATTIGRGTGALFALWRLTRPDGRVPVARRHLRVMPDVIGQITRISASGALQTLIATASWVVLVRIVSMFGSIALAGYTIGIRIVVFALLPSAGMSNAAATMVGQALGAKDPDRAESAVWRAGFYNLWFLGTAGLLFVIAAPLIVAPFTNDDAVANYATTCLRVVSSGFLFYAFGMVLESAFNGAGDTRTPTLLNIGIFWVLEIPLAWFLAHTLGMGPLGIFIAIAVAFSALALVSGWLFKRGAWKTKTV